jgi:phosphatidylserine decarboxylase
VAREGLPYVLLPVVLGVIAYAAGLWPIAFVLWLTALFMAFFFRDPRRVPPAEANIVVSPADGRVTRIAPVAPGDSDSPFVVSIFLSPFDVHINRSPIAGTITDLTYTKGKFLIATSDESSLVNEQNALTIRGDRITVVCKQIAGVLARRIICWKQPGENVSLGERFGLIQFSSRTDVLLPPQVDVTVKKGDRVRGGTTIIGRIR